MQLCTINVKLQIKGLIYLTNNSKLYQTIMKLLVCFSVLIPIIIFDLTEFTK